jgi:tripartite-type tricarboxylate transporter receptor subunit TctC
MRQTTRGSRHSYSLTTLALVAAITVCAAAAQDYPSKPIRILTSAPGGGGDFVARVLTQVMSGPLGQPLVVDNRGALLGIELAAQARPDGYTFIVGSNEMWLRALMQKVSYDPVKDFTPISLVVESPNIIVVNPSLPAKNVTELIVYARAKTDKLDFAGGSPGSASHLAGELFKFMAKLNMVYVPYKGAGAALNDTIAGQVPLLFSNLPTAGPQVKAGRLRALAITSAKPSALAPDMPTVASSGLLGYESAALFSLFGPAGVPKPIVDRMSVEVRHAVERPEVKDRVMAVGSEVVGSSAAELAARVNAEIKRMGAVVATAHLKLE